MAAKFERTRHVRYQPHVIIDKPNPFNGSVSSTWKGLLGALCLIEVNLVGLFFFTLNNDILFKLWIFNPISFISIIAIIVMPIIWLWFAGNQRRLDGTIERIMFNKRFKKGYECLSLFDKNITDSIVRSITGIIGFDLESGLFRSAVNEVKFGLKEHPYRGNWFVSYLVTVNFAESDDILVIENLFSVLKNIPAKHYVNNVMITSETVSHVMKDIEELLKQKDLPQKRLDSLYSIYEMYKGRTSIREPIYLLHVGLPFTIHKATAIRNMVEIQNSLIRALEDKKIHTTQIKDPNLLASLIKGALTCKMHLVRGIPNER